MQHADPRRTAADLVQAVDTAVTRVRTRAVDVSFNELFDMHRTNELIISPDFQRLFRWSVAKQSQFIESLILELPVPPIYAIEIEDGIYELIDGLQRISSYFHFRGKKPDAEGDENFLVLAECDVLPALNGATYPNLPQALQIKLKRHFIRMEVLRRESDARLRYHMFKRLNTGGEILSPQEIRNCTIRLLDNRFNEFLKEIARDDSFVTCMAALSEEKKEQMYMEEYALRFFALKNWRANYVKDVGDFLTEYMELVSDPERPDIGFEYEQERNTFLATFHVLAGTLGPAAFQSLNRQGNLQGQFSSLLFEALTMGVQMQLARIDVGDDQTLRAVAAALEVLKADQGFQRLTKGGGRNYAAALQERIAFVERGIEACLR